MMMRQAAMLGLVLLISGCAAFKPQPRPRPVESAAPRKAGPVPTNLGVTSGRVAVVNSQFRFVVVDFGGQRPPALGSALKLYRDGKAVGAVRLTEPVRGPLLTADIVEGEPRVGDEVR